MAPLGTPPAGRERDRAVTPKPAAGTFSMTSEAEQLVRLRKWLREELAGHDVPKQEQPSLLLAVGELCANSIEHAYDGRGGQPIHVSVRSTADSLVIEVEDFGKPFDAELYAGPELDAAPDSGYGLFLVKTIADSLTFDVARERGTKWSIVKYRPGHGPAAGQGSGTPRG